MAWDELPEGWELTPLADVAQDVQTGFACSARDEEGLPHLRPNNIGPDGKLDLTLVKRVPSEAGNLSKYGLKPGDVLFNNTNSQELVGKTAIFDLEGTYSFSNHLTRIRVRPDLLAPEWLSFWFQHLWRTRYFERICNRWIGQAGINTEKLSSIEVPLPPLPEQRRIVARIEELMERIDAARRLRAEADEEAAAILASALAEVFEEAKERGWQAQRLGEVADTVNGFGFPKEYQGRQGLQYPFVKVSDMNLPGNEVYLSRAVNTVDDNLLRQIRAKTYPAGTVIFPKIGGAVATNKKRILATEATFDNNVMGVIPGPLLDTKWLYYYLMSIDLMTLARATTMPSIRQSAVADLEMPLPSLDEQRRIVEYLDAVQAKVEAIRRYQGETQKEIEAMTGAVLEMAFRGEL